MSMLTSDQLCRLLMYALQRMKHSGSEPFQKPVQLDLHPSYEEYVFYPMDLSTLEKNITKKMYGSTEAFLADTKWLLHNCVLYNGSNHKLTTSARMVVKICEHEMSEIEICPDCYLSSCMKKDNYFCEPCREPHKLVWAKLKGFPFWPAKALRQVDGQVDVRFFGQHDRAWVASSSCYMMSEEIPFPIKKRKGAFENAMQEMELHIENIRRRHGRWEYASYRTPYDPTNTYNHNHLKFSSQQSGKLLNGVKDSTDPDNTRKVAKIKIKIKKSSGKLTLEGVDQDYIDASLKDGTGEDAETDKTMKHCSNKSRNIFEAMKIVDEEENQPSDPLTEKPKNLKTGLLKLKIGGGVVVKSAVSDSAAKPVLAKQSHSSPESEKPVPMGVFEISNDALDTVTPSTEGSPNTRTLTDTAKSNQTDIASKLTTRMSAEEKENQNVSESKPNMEQEDVLKVSDKGNVKTVQESPNTPDKQEGGKETDSDMPSILPTKLPSLSNLEEATLQLSPEHTNPVTPPSNRSTPSTDKFKMHLNKTIESCKASLGITETDVLEEMEQEKDAESESDGALLSNSADENEGREQKETEDEAMEEEAESCNSQEDNTMTDRPCEENTTMDIDEPKNDDICDAENKETDKITDVPSEEKPDLKVDDSKPENTSPVVSPKILPRDDVKVSPTNTKTDSNQSPDIVEIDVDGNSKEKPTVVRTPRKSPKVDSRTQEAVQKNGIASPEIIEQKKNENIQRKGPVTNDSVQTTEKINSSTTSIDTQKSSVSPPLQPVKFSARLAEKAAQRAAVSVTAPAANMDVTGVGITSLTGLTSTSTTHRGGTSSVSNAQVTDTEKLSVDFKKYSNKIMQYVDTSLQEFYQELSHNVNKVNSSTSEELTSSTIKKLKVDLEVMQWKHQQELAELRHNAELTVAEIRQSLQKEKLNSIADVKKEFTVEKQAAINETKKKQWCANCGKEAIFFCCWNTSYCDYPCQQSHWPEHMNSCAQSSTSAPSVPSESTDHREGGNIANQVRTAVSIQQAPTEGRKPNGSKSVVVNQPVQVQYVRQPVARSTPTTPPQVVVQTQVAPTVQSYGPVLAPMNTLTRAPTTIVQQRPIIQQGTYPVLRPQGGIVTQTVTQNVPTQIVVRPQMPTVAPGPMQIRNVVSYPRSRPV
ncbi:MYND-type zinc finger-containing chromatin reader ZMYND8-like [Glandiceps talaboti]